MSMFPLFDDVLLFYICDVVRKPPFSCSANFHYMKMNANLMKYNKYILKIIKLHGIYEQQCKTKERMDGERDQKERIF